jgi:hypothetical protein
MSPDALIDDELPLALNLSSLVMIKVCSAEDCGRNLLGCSRVMSLLMKD